MKTRSPSGSTSNDKAKFNQTEPGLFPALFLISFDLKAISH